jgi:hypothetical protein
VLLPRSHRLAASVTANDRSRIRQFDRAFGEIDWYISIERLFEEEVLPEDVFEESERMIAGRQIDAMNDMGHLRRILA